MAITLRSTKGSALSHAELDQNFTDLRDGTALLTPASGVGMKIGPYASPTYGWHDLLGSIHFHDGAATAPSIATYAGTLDGHLYAEGDACHISYHLPHDYVPDSEIFIHVHWSHNATNVTGGSVTFKWELTYAKGHQQAAFATPVVITEQQNASATQYMHMICEAPASTPGGSAYLLDTNAIEVDGLIFGKLTVFSNDITVSGGVVPDIFVHEVDIHYQSTNVATKNRAPSFYA